MTRDDGGVSEQVRPRSRPLTTHTPSTTSRPPLPTSSSTLGEGGRGLASLKVQLVTLWRPTQPVEGNTSEAGRPSVGKLSQSWWRVEGHPINVARRAVQGETLLLLRHHHHHHQHHHHHPINSSFSSRERNTRS